VVETVVLPERALLLTDGPARRSGRLRFQRAMHSLVSTVLLRVTRLDSFVSDPELGKENSEARKPPWRATCERRPVVAPDRVRKAVLTERRTQDRFELVVAGARRRVHLQQVPTEVILQRQRHAVTA